MEHTCSPGLSLGGGAASEKEGKSGGATVLSTTRSDRTLGVNENRDPNPPPSIILVPTHSACEVGQMVSISPLGVVLEPPLEPPLV